MGSARKHTSVEKDELRKMASRLEELARLHYESGCDEDQFDNACRSGAIAATFTCAALLIRREVGIAEEAP